MAPLRRRVGSTAWIARRNASRFSGAIRYSTWISTGPSSGIGGSTAIASSGSCTPGVTSASLPMRTARGGRSRCSSQHRRRRRGQRDARVRRPTPARPRTRCPAPGSPAPRPGSSPRRARAPTPARCSACRRTGSRSTLTHATPAPSVPTTAPARCSRLAAISTIGAGPQQDAAAVTTVLSERRCSCRGIDSAPATAPMPKRAEQHAVAARAEPELVARDHRQQRPQRARADAEDEVADDQRAHRRRMPRVAQPARRTPENSVSGTPGSGALAPWRQRRTATIISTKNSDARDQRAAGAEPRRDRPRQRRSHRARDVERHRAQRDRARQLVARDQLVDARLLRRHVEREAGADQEREREQRRRPDRCRPASRCRARRWPPAARPA